MCIVTDAFVSLIVRLYNFGMQASKRPRQIVPLCLWALLLCAACDTAPLQPQPTVLPAAGDAAIQVFFTRPQALDVPGRRTDGVDKYVSADIENAATSIDIAAYDINLQSITDALLAASLRGVQVRVVTDSDNLARSPVAQLRSVGITVTCDERSALMHDKFIVVDGTIMFTGSWNPTDNDTWRNNNNLLRITAPPIVQNFVVEFAEMLQPAGFGPRSPATTPFASTTVEGVLVETYFSPEDGVAAHILGTLRGAQHSVHFMAFSFTRQDFADVLLERAAAGVAVRGVFEDRLLSGSGRKVFERLQSAGVPVLADGNRYTMHHKVFVIDATTVVTGSYNFSAAAEDSNDENVVILHGPALADLFETEFDEVWARAARAAVP